MPLSEENKNFTEYLVDNIGVSTMTRSCIFKIDCETE